MMRIGAVVIAAFLLAGCATLGETHNFSGPFVGVNGGSGSDPAAAH